MSIGIENTPAINLSVEDVARYAKDAATDILAFIVKHPRLTIAGAVVLFILYEVL